MTQRQRAGLARAMGDAARVLGGQDAGAKAYCLECAGLQPAPAIDPAITPATRGALSAWLAPWLTGALGG